jgi:hypothetical protein
LEQVRLTKPTEPARVLNEKTEREVDASHWLLRSSEPAMRLWLGKRPMAGHCFCRFMEVNTAGNIVAQIFRGQLPPEPESAGLDAANSNSDAIFLRARGGVK